jgi:8-amino-7-oxononanoate synthase
LRDRLWLNIHRFAQGLQNLGFPAPPRSPIFPVVLGSARRATGAARQLRGKGLLVKAIRPPTVSPGTSRLRFSITAAHTPEQIDLALASLREIQELP